MSINLPNQENCLKLLDKYGTSSERFKVIKEHSITVANASVFLAKRLKDAGENIDVSLVKVGALLHDIGKAESIKQDFKIDHALEGYKILIKEGLPKEVALIAKNHLRMYLKKCKTWEEKIIIYVDCCAERDKIISIEKRNKKLIERYKNTSIDVEKELKEAQPLLNKIEKEIFSKINLKPEELAKYVANEN
jgi:uncharacterized protein